MLFLIAFNDKWLISFVLSRDIWKKQLKAVLLMASAMLHSAVWFQNLVQAQLWVECEAAAVTEFICSVKTVPAQFRHSLCLTLTLLSFQNNHKETFHWDDDKQYGDIGIKGYQKMVPINGAYGRKWRLGYIYFSKELHKQKQSFEIKQTCTCQGK